MANAVSRRRLLSTGLVLAGATTLAACGATPTPQVIEKVVEKEVTKIVEGTPQVVKETVVVTETQVVEKEVTVAPAQTGPAVVTWEAHTDPARLPWMQSTAEEFQKLNPDVTVNLLIISEAEATTKLMAMAAAGTPVDIWTTYGISFVDSACRELTRDLSPFIEKDQFDLSDWDPAMLDRYERDGKLMGIPIDAMPSLLYYNVDLFQAAGLPEPTADWHDLTWTWDALVDTAGKLTKDYADVAKGQYGLVDGLWPYESNMWLWGQEPYDAEALKTGFATESNLDAPLSVSAFQARADLVYKDQVSPTPEASQALSALGAPLGTGRLAMQMTGGWVWAFKPLTEQVNWSIAALPRAGDNTVDPPTTPTCCHFIDPYMLAAGSAHPDAAWKLFKYIVWDGAESFAEMSGAPPARKSLLPKFIGTYEHIPKERFEMAWNGGMETGHLSPSHLVVGFTRLDSVVSAELDPLYLGKQSATDVLPVAAEKVEAVLQEIKAQGCV